MHRFATALGAFGWEHAAVVDKAAAIRAHQSAHAGVAMRLGCLSSRFACEQPGNLGRAGVATSLNPPRPQVSPRRDSPLKLLKPWGRPDAAEAVFAWRLHDAGPRVGNRGEFNPKLESPEVQRTFKLGRSPSNIRTPNPLPRGESDLCSIEGCLLAVQLG